MGCQKDAKVDDFIKDVLRLSPYHYDLFCEILKVFGKILMVKQELTHQNFLTSTSLSILDSDGSNPKTWRKQLKVILIFFSFKFGEFIFFHTKVYKIIQEYYWIAFLIKTNEWLHHVMLRTSTPRCRPENTMRASRQIDLQIYAESTG